MGNSKVENSQITDPEILELLNQEQTDSPKKLGSVVLAEVPELIANFFERNYSRGKSQQRTTFVVSAILEKIAKSGCEIRFDGVVIPKQHLPTK